MPTDPLFDNLKHLPKDRAPRASFAPDEWAAIIEAWNSGVSYQGIYHALREKGRMPYRSDRHFLAAIQNKVKKLKAAAKKKS